MDYKSETNRWWYSSPFIQISQINSLFNRRA